METGRPSFLDRPVSTEDLGGRPIAPSYLGKGATFDRAIANFSASYADQNERDYEAFTAAVKSGRLTAQTDL